MSRTSSSTAVLLRLASNTGWLMLDRLVSITVAVAAGLYFARYLGPEGYGLYNYALSLFGIFAVIGKLGINPLVIGEIVESPARQPTILGTAFVLRMVAALACLALLNVTALAIMEPGVTRQLTFVFSIALLLVPFETITHWFEANLRMRPVAVARSVIAILSGAGKLAFIVAGVTLLPFAWLVPLEGVLTALLFVAVYHNYGLRIWNWRVDASLIRKFSHQGTPLFFSTLAVMTYMKIDQVMLGKMSSPTEVGIYSAAVKISEVFYFFPVLLSGLLFPYLIKFDKLGDRLFKQAFQLMCDGFAWMALFIAVVLTTFSTQIVTLAYGEPYLQSANILVVHVWAGLFIFAEALRSKWFVIRQSTRFQFMTTTSGALLNVLLNLYLIPRYQGYGAAIATTLSYAVAVVFSCFLHRETRALGTILLKSLLAPFRILETARTWGVVRASVDRPHSEGVEV